VDELLRAAPLILSLALLTVTVIAPLATLLIYTLKISLLELPALIGAELSKPLTLRVLRFTALQAALSATLSLCLGLSVGLIGALWRIRGFELVRGLGVVAFMLPSMVVATSFRTVYGAGGLLSSHLPQLAVLGGGLSGIIAAHVFYNAPLALNLIYSSVTSIPRSQLEDAMLDGAGTYRLLIDIVIPQALPALVSSWVLCFLYCFTSMGVPLLLGGPREWTLEVYIYYLTVSLFELERGTVLALLQLMFLALLTYSYLKLAKVFEIAPIGSSLDLRAPRALKALLYIAVSSFTVYEAVPLLGAAYSSLFNPFTGGFGLEGYLELFSEGFYEVVGTGYLRVICNTLVMALLSASIALALGTSAALSSSQLMESLLFLPLITSPITLALGLYLTYWALAPNYVLIPLAHAAISAPLASRAIVEGARRIPRELIDATKIYSSGNPLAAVRALGPLLLPSFGTAAAFSLAISMGEFGATLFLHTTETTTMTIAVYKLAAARRFQMAAAQSTMLAFFTAALAIMVLRVSSFKVSS